MSNTRWYALVGQSSGELLTYRGDVLVHDSAAELEFLVPGPRVVEVTAELGRSFMRVRDHPGFASVRWPLRREDFR